MRKLSLIVVDRRGRGRGRGHVTTHRRGQDDAAERPGREGDVRQGLRLRHSGRTAALERRPELRASVRRPQRDILPQGAPRLHEAP